MIASMSRMLGDQRSQMLLGLVGAIEAVEIGRHLDRGVAMQRRRRGHSLIDLDRELGLFQPLVKIGEREQRQRMIRREVKRELQIDEARSSPPRRPSEAPRP